MQLRTPRHRHIMAAAGTGKTFQLTGEYIHRAFLELECGAADGGCGLGGILATTFTRKAAGEILDRVLERLAKACTVPEELASLRAQVAPDLSRDDCRRLLTRLLAELDRLSIQTLDAFFLRVATGLSLDTGLPPGWTIADEDVDAQLREEAMWNVIASEIGNGRGDALLDVMSLLSGGKLKSSIIRPFARAIATAYSSHLDGGCAAEPWEAVDTDGMPGVDDDAIDDAVEALRLAPLPTTGRNEPNKNWVKAQAKLLHDIMSGDWEGMLSGGLLAKIIENPESPTYSRVDFPRPFLEACLPIVDAAKLHAVELIRARNLAARIILDRFHEAYLDLKRATGRYSFDDLPRMLSGMTKGDGGVKGVDRDSMYFMIDTRLRHVLLDEFQDTSRVQYSLLRPILEELFAAAPEGHATRSVFCVGDVKQSIYAWRNAEPGLMPAVADQMRYFHRETMRESRRSSPAVIDAVNAVFGGLADNPALGDRHGAAASWCRHFEAHAAHHATLAGRVRLRTCGLDPDDDKPDPMRTAAEVVRELQADQPLATVGVLLRSRKPIATILRHLQRLGIEASEESGTSLLDTPATSATISALHLADLPGDKAAAFHVAAGPIGRLLDLTIGVDGILPHADSQRAASAIRARFASGGVAGVVGWIREGCVDALTASESLRMEQLLDLAERFDERSDGGLSDFVRLARRERVEDPSRARVRVMTIHASKGLEFDAVVLPELSKKWSTAKGMVVTRRKDVFSEPNLLSLPGAEHLRACHEGLSDAYDQCLERSIEEEISCLYVAMTRARRALELIIEPSEKEPSGLCAASVLRHALAAGAAPQDTVLWTTAHGDAWHAGFTAEAKAQSPNTVRVSLRAASGSTTPRRSRVASPSSLHDVEKPVSEIFTTRGERSANEGTLLHAWAESIEWHAGQPPAPAPLLQAARDHGVEPARASELIELFGRSLADGVGVALSKGFHDARGPADELDLRREWAFRTTLTPSGADDPLDLAGRIDRLVVGRLGGKAVWADVIDFKSDDIDAANCDGRARGHAAQMTAYASAVARMFRLPREAVACHVAFLRPGRVVTLRDEP